MRTERLLLLAICLLAGGCTFDEMFTSSPKPVAAATNPVEDALTAAARETQTAMAKLAALEQATKPPPPPAPKDVPPELAEPITISWSGPAVRLLERLSAKLGYSFVVLGPVPPTLPTVIISAENLPLWQVLYDAGLQLRSRATVAVRPRMKGLELRYE